MAGRIALDTNIVIAFIKGELSIKQKVDTAETVMLPIPVAGELIYGASKSQNMERNLQQCMAFIGKCVCIPCDLEVADMYGKVRSSLFSMGSPLPENDIWIAACCIVSDVPLATRDAHFDKIPDLKIEKW